MTTRTTDVFGFGMRPGNTSAVYAIPLKGISGYAGTSNHLVMAFEADAAINSMHFGFYVPDEYVTDGQLDLLWFSGQSGGDDVVWRLQYHPVAAGERMDSTSFESVDAIASVSSHLELDAVSLSLSSSLIAAGDWVQCLLSRAGTNSQDSQAGTCYLASARFSYSDS